VTPLLHNASAGLGTGFLLDLLRTLLALAGVCLLVWIGARRLAGRGFGVPQSGPIASVRVLRRIALEPRKNLYLVQAGKRVLLIGTGEGGPPSLLAELDAESIDVGVALGQPARQPDA